MESIPDYLIGNMVQVYGWQSKEGLWDTISTHLTRPARGRMVLCLSSTRAHALMGDRPGRRGDQTGSQGAALSGQLHQPEHQGGCHGGLESSSTGQEGEQAGTSTWRFARLGHRMGLQSGGPQTGVSGPHQTIETSLGSPEPTMYGVQPTTSPHELQAQSERCSARRSRRTSSCGTCGPYRMDSDLGWKRLLVRASLAGEVMDHDFPRGTEGAPGGQGGYPRHVPFWTSDSRLLENKDDASQEADTHHHEHPGDSQRPESEMSGAS